MLQLKSTVVLRREPDGTGILFDADTGNAFILNPTSSVICSFLRTGAEEAEIVRTMRQTGDLPPDAETQISAFIESLKSRGLVTES